MKNFFLKTGLTLLCLIIGLGSAWGETASVELCTSWNTALAYATAYTNDYTIDNLNEGTTTLTLGVQGVYRQSNSNTYFQMNKKSGYFKNTTKLPGKIKKIETTWSAAKGATKCYFAENAQATSSDEIVTVTAATSVTYTPPTDADYYYFNIDPSTGSGSAQMTSCIVYYESVSAATPHTVTFVAGSNGSCSTSSLTEASAGAGVTLPSCTANTNYTFVGWSTSSTPTSADAGTAGANYKPSADCTLYACYTYQAPSHTAHFSINGTIDNTKDCTVAEDAAITLPSDLDDINGKKFMGWVSYPIDGTTKTAPTFVTSPTMGTSDVTYYAVYATASGSEQTYHLTQNEIKASTARSSYSDITVNSASGTWTGKAIVNTSTGYIQINKNANNYNLCTPEFSAPITKIDIYTTNSTPAGRTFYLRSDNLTAQPTSSQIGSASLSEVAGSVSINVNSSQPLNQLYIYSSAAMYISNIDVTCGTASYSDYCTTVDTSTPSITANNTLEIPAAETDGTFNVTWTGFGDDMIEVNLYNNEACTVAFNGDWFDVELDDDNNVYYLAGENTSTSPRTVYMQLCGLDSEATEYTHVVTVTQAGKQGDPEITNFIKTSPLELVVGAEPYDIRNCLNIPSDYDTSTYAITTTINGLTQKDGEYACVYPYIAFSKAGEYTVHVVAAAMPGKYAQTEGNITVTVTDPAPAITTIPALFTKATEVGNTKTDIKLTFDNWVVSGVKGSNAYVTDGTNGFIIYQSDHGFTAGDVLSGTVDCKVYLYNGAADIIGLTSTTTGLTVSTSAEELTPTVISDLTTLSGVNTGALIKINNVQYDGTNFTDGTNVIKPYTGIMDTLPELTNGAYYNVTGVYVQYNTTKEIAPRFAEDIEEVQAEKYAINIAPCENGTVTASLEEAAAGVEVTLTVTPNSGYQLSTLAVTNASTSEEITVTSNKFIMPAADVNVTATFEEATPSDIIFYESFDTNEGTGGNDGAWSGTIAGNDIKSDNEDWTFVKGNGADQCAKFGTGSAKGSATTPALNYTGNATLTFKAGAWNSSNEKTTLNISIDGDGSTNPTSVTLTKGEWTEYTITLTGLTAGSKIKFEANAKDNNRFFLDEVTVTKSSITPATEYDITIASGIENGTISASKAKAEEGDNITITATPATGYQLATLYYTIDGDETQNTIENLTFTMPANNVTIHATFMETITGTFSINYSVNGIIRKTETLEANASLNFPAVSSMYGKVFLGWTTSEVPDEVDVQPETVGAIKATTDATYYALFATKNSTAGSDELTKVDELVAGMDVILAMEEDGVPSEGISDVNVEGKTAVVSATKADWLKFSVNEIGENTCLVYNNQFVTPSTNSNNMFSLTENNGTSFYINEDYHLAYMKGKDEYVLAWNHDKTNGDYYRFYKTSTIENNTGTAQVYTLFFVYTDGSSTTYSAYTTLPSYVKLDESTTNGTYENETFGTVKIIRSMKADDTWNSLCLPFSMDEEQITTAFGEDTDVRELTTASVTGTAPDEVLHLNFTQVTAIEAGKLYMVRVPAAISEFYVEDTEVNTAKPVQDYSKDGYTIQTHSNYNYMDGPTNGYVPVGSFVISSNKFMQVGSSTQKMKAFRGYITATDASGNPVKALGIGFIDPLTGINNVEFNTDARIYNLQGLQQSKFQKGINIVNGKKVIR